LNVSDGALGIPGVSYSQGTDRGLDNNTVNLGHGVDDFFVSADQRTFNIQAWTTTTAIDEVRVILAVPESSTWAAGALTFVALVCSRRHRPSRLRSG
jgi:hypothetical protein